MWLNADVLRGPGYSVVDPDPVDGARFFALCKERLAGYPLSPGWKTKSAPDATYTGDDVAAMVKALEEAGVADTELTFPVRANLASRSAAALATLLDSVPSSSLTIWSAIDDQVEADQVAALIKAVGKDRAFLDVPDALDKAIRIHM